MLKLIINDEGHGRDALGVLPILVPSLCPCPLPMAQVRQLSEPTIQIPQRGLRNPRLQSEETSSLSKDPPPELPPIILRYPPDRALSKFLTFKAESSLRAQQAEPRGPASLWLMHLGQPQTRSGPAAGQQELASMDCPAAWPRGCSSWGARQGSCWWGGGVVAGGGQGWRRRSDAEAKAGGRASLTPLS